MFSHFIEELHHLLQVLLRVHFSTAMVTVFRECTLGLYTSSLQQFEELLTLTVWYYFVLSTMEDSLSSFDFSRTSSGLLAPIDMCSPQSISVRSTGPDQSQAALTVLG